VRYQICHQTTYTYSQTIRLQPHLLRLQPRSDSWQSLHQFSYAIAPNPFTRSSFNDFDGNCLTQLGFEQPTQQLQVTAKSIVETKQSNPFNFLLEPWAIRLPIDYPASILSQLQPYLQPYFGSFDPEVIQLARKLSCDAQGDVIAFLMALTQYTYETCAYTIRETGDPWPAGVTWAQKQGSCRDLAVLMMEACRSAGLGARFVSGYDEGDRIQERRDLHAWVEIYLPGAGWRGFDPTQGLAVSDRHISLVASAFPRQTAPVVGSFALIKSSDDSVQTRLETLLTIEHLDSETP
jgi:transglutaminase-like putative cysteine protease